MTNQSNFNYCQRDIDDKPKCMYQCDHCKAYYAILEASANQGSETKKDKHE
jgi:predicted ATP-dependent serine protease